MSSSAVLFLFVPRAFWGSCDLMIMFCDKFKSASCKTYLIPVTCWMEGVARSLSAWTSRSISTHLFSEYLILSGFESNRTFLNSNSIGNARTFVTWACGSGNWVTTPQVVELKNWFDLIWFEAPASSWPDSSTGGALYLRRRGQGSSPRSSLNFST